VTSTQEFRTPYGSRWAVPEALVSVGVPAALGAFWVLTLYGGTRAPGYDPIEDTLSALAARGPGESAWGVAAGLALALAHALAALGLWQRGHRVPAALLSAATGAGVALLLLPVTCPRGPAGCSGVFSGRSVDLTSAMHRNAAAAYAALFALTCFALSYRQWRAASRPSAVLVAAAACLSVVLALGLRTGIALGLWERAWVALNSVLLLWLFLPRRLPELTWPGAARRAGCAALLLGPVLLVLGAHAQPAFDPRTDLISNLASYGADLPWLGRSAILAVAAAYLTLCLVLAAAGRGWSAAAAAAAAVSAAGIALVPLQCPRGAHGCSGPDSGRAVPRPRGDIVHRDLVAAFEVALLLLLVLLAVGLLRRRVRALASLLLAFAVLSVVLLGGQQVGDSIGWWQLAWFGVVLAAAAVALAWSDLVAGPPRRTAARSPVVGSVARRADDPEPA
jgi:hypothetical protein